MIRLSAILRVSLLFLAVSGVVAAPVVAVAHDGRHDGASDADLVQSVLPAVVNIFVRKPPEVATQSASASASSPGTTQPQGTEGQQWKRYYGSGFVIDPDGIIVTNRHVIEDARDIIIGFMDGRRAMGKLMASGGEADIALVKVTTDKPLPVLKFGDSDQLRIGDHVLAFGNPLGVGLSVSSGIVSALNRDIKDTPYDNFIQTDAAINHGNSGGPLVNTAGEVIGINTALYSDIDNGGSIGLGFAITSNDAQFLIERLRRYGRVRAGWIGAALQDVTPVIAEAMNLPPRPGAIIDSLDPGMPAAKAGLREGDELLTVDDQTPTDARAFMRAFARLAIGSTAQVTIWREGQQLVLPVVVTDWPGDVSNDVMAAAAQHFDAAGGGLRLAEITPLLRSKYNIASDQQGVVVTGVAPELLTGERSLVPGDTILRVQNVAVSSPEDVWKTLDRARQEKRRLVVMLVRGRDGQIWLPLLLTSMH